MSGFNFTPAPGAKTAAPQAAAPQAAGGLTEAQRNRAIMEQAFGKGGNVEIVGSGAYETPGTTLDRVENVKFYISKNEGKGTQGQSFVHVVRTVIRVLDDAKGLAAKPGSTTTTTYNLTKSKSYADCALFMATMSDVPHTTLTPADMATACEPSQMFAGVCVISHRFHLPQNDSDRQSGKLGFLKNTFRTRVTAEDLLTGAAPGMGGPLTPQEKAQFFGGQDPVDPLWITAGLAERWARGNGSELPSADALSAMSDNDRQAYYDALIGAYVSRAK